MLRLDARRGRYGFLRVSFVIRNRQEKVIAFGKVGRFVRISHKRYANDPSLVAKVRQLTGLTPSL
jgi:hypothetical protein